MTPRPLLGLAGAAFLLGLLFAAFSTADFVAHLDRQVHGLHCSFVPGLAAADASGSSGCHVALMSPYSSLFRTAIWGGLPISMLAMGTYAFLASFAFAVAVGGGGRGRTGFLALGGVLPVLASIVMGTIAATQLHAFCKLCTGMYTASAVGLIASILAWRAQPFEEEQLPLGAHAAAFLLGVVVTLLPAGVYAALAPDFSRFVGACGELKQPADPQGVLVPLGGATGGAPAVEVFDPLCPSCRGFEERLSASGLAARLERKLLLFPLDDTCNWMVGDAIHPGACDVSEAILCAEGQRDAVIAWAFEHQEELVAAAKASPGGAAALAKQAFPAVAGCLGSPAVKKRLNRGLRWAVANELPVLTPQVYVRGKKLCDEDTDLGMDWALSRLLDAEAR